MQEVGAYQLGSMREVELLQIIAYRFIVGIRTWFLWKPMEKSMQDVGFMSGIGANDSRDQPGQLVRKGNWV